MADPQTAGTLGSATIRLAVDVDPPSDRYQRQYIPVTPSRPPTLSASEGAQPADSETQLWKVASWAGGEGESRWKPDSDEYYQSSAVRPLRIGDGVELGAATVKTVGSAGVAFNGGNYLVTSAGLLWCAKDTNIYQWDSSVDRWDTTGIAIGSASPVVSMASPGDGYIYVGLADKTVRRVKSGTNAQWLAAQTFEPIMYAWGGVLFMLVGDDLYEVDVSVAGTTLRADLSGTSTIYRADITSRDRISGSERGPIWLQRLDTGETYIWEYNVYADAQSRLGRMPVDYAWPYSIRYANGFVFVGFRYANAAAGSGDGYVYFVRGAQNGVLGPARSLSGSTASQSVTLAGVVGEQIIFVFDGAVWGYTPSTGGLSQVGLLTTQTTPYHAVTFGSQIFVSGLDDGTAGVVDMVDLDAYTTTGTVDTGRWDFWYPGLQKVLLEVTVQTDPLPASATVDLSVSKDGGSYTSVSGSHSVDGASSYTWTVSDTSTTVAAKDFSLRLTLGGTASATPTIRSVVARAGSGAYVLQWVLSVDCNTSKTGSQSSESVIDTLNAMTTSGPQTFTDPWQNTEYVAADTFTVQVREVVTPMAQSDGSAVAKVRVRQTSLIEVS